MENNLDKLFKSKLGEQEPEFHPSAWEKMEGLLDVAGMIPVGEKSNKPRKFYSLFLIFGILISVIGYYLIQSNNVNGEGSTLIGSGNSNLESKQTIKANFKTTSGANSNRSNSTKVIAGQNKDEMTHSSSIQKSYSPQEIESTDNPNINEDNLYVPENSVISNTKLLGQVMNPASETIETDNGDRTKINVGNTLQNDLVTKKLIINQSKSKIIKDHTPNQNENNIPYIKSSVESENSIPDLQELKSKEILPFLNVLNTKQGHLLFSHRLITPQIQKIKSAIFEIGIHTSIRYNAGLGYSIGPYISYTIGKRYAINLGGQFDSQNFEGGPELIVFDKEYSFGSKLRERKFSLSNQKSLRIPLVLRKSFQGFSLSSGVMFNKVFASGGSISKAGDGNVEEGVIIDNEMIHAITISFQLGASMSLSRYLDFDFGIEYKPKTFVTGPSTSKDNNKYYPTLGLRYKLFKF